MKAISIERGAFTRRLERSALLGLISALALGACGNDGPTYGEIPRDAGRSGSSSSGKGGMAQTTGGTENAGGDEAGGAGGEDSGGSKAGSAAHAGKGGKGGKGGMGGSSGSSGSGGTSLGGGGGGGGGTSNNSLCGNSVVDPGETCDDGNKVSGDGCSSTCQCGCEACETSEGCYYREPQVTTANGVVYYDAGYDMEGLAAEGPAPNVPRKVLFRDALDCVHQTACVTVTPGGATLIKCACLNLPEAGEDPIGWPAACFNDALLIKGPCWRQIMEAAEADSLLAVKERTTTEDYAIAMVQGIVRNCDTEECRSECFTPEQSAGWRETPRDALFSCANCKAENACMPIDGAAP